MTVTLRPSPLLPFTQGGICDDCTMVIALVDEAAAASAGPASSLAHAASLTNDLVPSSRTISVPDVAKLAVPRGVTLCSWTHHKSSEALRQMSFSGAAAPSPRAAPQRASLDNADLRNPARRMVSDPAVSVLLFFFSAPCFLSAAPSMSTAVLRVLTNPSNIGRPHHQ